MKLGFGWRCKFLPVHLAFRLAKNLTVLLTTLLLLGFATAHAKVKESVPTTMAVSEVSAAAKDLKVYVMIGFHVDFYHSWRGDAPDDSGFGYDYKVISSSIRTLNKASQNGLKAKAYWDFAANHWTFGEFLPKHFPDLIDAWKSRDNIDEFVIGPYNNGLNSAATKREFSQAIGLTLENPGNFGLKQMFKNVGMVYRPQEMFFASGQVNWLHDLGIHTLILQYASYAFNAFSNFVKPLQTSDRFNPIWFKSHESDKPIVVLPSLSPVDILNFGSLQRLMIDLRRQQLEGKIKRNVVIHMNIDADAKSWMPMLKNRTLRRNIPNTGGLDEIIHSVNKYSWSDFTTPTEYLKIEKPETTIMVKQDMADGSFDGMQAWAEKESSQSAWTEIERSRAMERLLASRMWQLDASHALRERRDQGDMARLLALSTTHFGMSVPFVHFERKARFDGYAATATTASQQTFWSWRSQAPASQQGMNEAGVLLFDYPKYGESKIAPLFAEQKDLVAKLSSPASRADSGFERIKLAVNRNSRLAPSSGEYVRREFNSQIDELEIFSTRADLRTEKIVLKEGAPLVADVNCGEVEADGPSSLGKIDDSFNDVAGAGGVKIHFAHETGVSGLEFQSESWGGSDFLSPFVGFKSDVSIADSKDRRVLAAITKPSGYQISMRACLSAPSIREVTLKTHIRLPTEREIFDLPIEYRFWRSAHQPYVYLDVNGEIPYTIDASVPQQADRRYMQHIDWRWTEIALSQLKPDLNNARELNVWKMNYEGLISSYRVNQGEINAKNLNIDSMNNHLTPGWVAISSGKRGFLIAFNALKRSSFAAVPMRVRSDSSGVKSVALNPFGTYFGKQLDYSHVGGERLGTLLANIGASYISPSAPSFVGKSIHYELMMAPYEGDRPSDALIRDALRFAYPRIGIVSLPGQAIYEDTFSHMARLSERSAAPPPVEYLSAELKAPVGFAAASLDGAINTSWLNRSAQKIDGYQVLWREIKAKQWQSTTVDASTEHYLINGLKNGTKYALQVRALRYASDGPAIVSPVSSPQFVRPNSNVASLAVNKVSPNLKLLYLALEMIIKQAQLTDPDLATKAPAEKPTQP